MTDCRRGLSKFVRTAAITAALAWAGVNAHAETLTLTAIKDNTLIQDPNGGSSNALGDAVYCGRTGIMAGFRRLRPVILFDLAILPPGSTIQRATLKLYLIQANSNNHSITVHRALADWGEGSSFAGGGSGSDATPGDATWLHRYYPNVFWQTEGGDFDATVLATTVVGITNGPYTWSSAAMATVVQSWLDDPAGNHGWLLKGNEVNNRTAKKFASKDHQLADLRPQLIVEYTPPVIACPADIVADKSVNVNDLLAVINSWGGCAAPCPPACASDIWPGGGDCAVNVNDLLTVINQWGACP